MKNLEHYNLLAEIFKYPSAETANKIAEIKVLLDEKYPEAGEEFTRFSDFMANSTKDEIEEIFGKTFHIQAICFLDLGYVIFGEDYKRGEFLVNMKEEQRKAGIDCGIELADNLPNILRLIAIHKDQQFLDEMVSMIMLPAIEKMLSEFDERKTRIRENVLNKKQKVIIMKGIKNGNIYKNALSMLFMVLKEDFKHIDFKKKVDVVTAQQRTFLNARDNASDCGDCATPIPTPNEIKEQSMAAAK